MTQEQFVIEVQKVAMQSNPDLVNSTSYEDVLKELTELKDKAMRWEILRSSFKPEPQLPNFDNSPERFKQLAKDRMSQRQGEL